MAGTHNFKVFDESNTNVTSDANYSSDAARLGGVQNGVADPLSANKAWHQATIMAAAIAQFVANQGLSVDDTNLNNLVNSLADSIASLAGISYADRTAHGMFGTADVGPLSFCPAQGTPAAATYTVGATGNLLGGYHYREVLISGYVNPDGTYFVRGFSPADQRSTYDVSPSSQQVTITNLPHGSVGCIGRALYRSAANGVAGSEKYCGIIWDNTTTTYTDNLVDSQLGTGMPTVQGAAIPANVPTTNTTGTSLPASQVSGGVPSTRKINGHTLDQDVNLAAPDVGAVTKGGMWWDSSSRNYGSSESMLLAPPSQASWIGGLYVNITYDGATNDAYLKMGLNTGNAKGVYVRLDNTDDWGNTEILTTKNTGSNVPLTTPGLRNTTISSAAPSGGNDGDTWDQV